MDTSGILIVNHANSSLWADQFKFQLNYINNHCIDCFFADVPGHFQKIFA